MKARKESLRAALYPAAAVSLLLLTQQSFAAAPTAGNLDQWSINTGTISATCPAGYTCGTEVIGDGFYQRQIIDPARDTFFQTIIFDTGAPPPPPQPPLISCPINHVCASIIKGDDFNQQEISDGTDFQLETAFPDEGGSLANAEGPPLTPLHMFYTAPGTELKLGPHLANEITKYLPDRFANLHLDRYKLTADPEYLGLNQQSEDAQKIYRKIVDVNIIGVTVGESARLSAQLNVPLEIPSGYELRPRVLNIQSWTDFVSDEKNRIAAADKLDTGFCPAPDSPLYQKPFGKGVECIQVTIQDGGPNDGDGKTDGNVALTTGVILKATELKAAPQVVEPTITEAHESTKTSAPDNTASTDNPRNSEDSGGGGVWPWWLSLAAAGMLLRHNRRQRRAV